MELDRGKYQEDICLYGSWMNDEIKMSRMAGTAAPLLGATQQAVMSQMSRYSQLEERKQEQANSRTLERERMEDMTRRNSSDDLEVQSVNDEPVQTAEAVPQYKKVNDRASGEEIALFAYALSLGSVLSESKKIMKADVLRPDDFSGDTLRELVKIFLNICDGRNETLYARALRPIIPDNACHLRITAAAGT